MVEDPKLVGEPEVSVSKPGKKRKIPFEEQCQIVRYYDSLPDDGSKGSYLRRNGLFKSSLSGWRAKMAGAVEPGRPGPKPAGATERELRRLREEVMKLTTDLERANAIIEVQKKVSRLFELHMEQKAPL
ncbi:hypothetical protein HY772_09080 [Candidatus Woesearchaeota archaeon]|nr:hypothetical protein [Candidatus Woesearchaeota archaeon]